MEAKNGMKELIYWKKYLIKVFQQPQKPLVGPIRFELRPQGRKLGFLRPPRSQRLGAREAGVPSITYYQELLINHNEKRIYFPSQSQKNSYFYQPLFCRPNQLLDQLKIESPKSNGCYFDDLILKFEHVKHIIRPIEIKNSAWWFLFHTTACLLAFCGEKRKAFPLQF